MATHFIIIEQNEALQSVVRAIVIDSILLYALTTPDKRTPT